MADIELVIKIPKEYYKAITEIPNHQCTADMLIIKNGTPIPDNASILSVTEFADRCRECGARYGKLLKQKLKQKSEKWIPFSERLPKPFEHCLITTTDGEVIYHYDDWHYSKYKAWMPLPKPYEPQERSE